MSDELMNSPFSANANDNPGNSAENSIEQSIINSISADQNSWIKFIEDDPQNFEITDILIKYFITQGGDDEVILDICARYNYDDLIKNTSLVSQFNIATALMNLKRYEDSFNLYKKILEKDPSFEECKLNIYFLAKNHLTPSAIMFYRNEMNIIGSSFPRRFYSSKDAPHQSEFRPPFDMQALHQAIDQYGVCVIRDGCDVDVIRGVQDHLKEGHYDAFPVTLNDFLLSAAEKLFKFDAAALMSAVLGRPAAIKPQASVLRHVYAGLVRTELPFHQDCTAFAEQIANIWAPLTKAGGDHPTLQLIRKRIDIAEQAKIVEGEYNLVEIDEARVLRKYGDHLLTIESANPGDCVIFLGTTIHRSYNFKESTLPRYNLEVRWG